MPQDPDRYDIAVSFYLAVSAVILYTIYAQRYRAYKAGEILTAEALTADLHNCPVAARLHVDPRL